MKAYFALQFTTGLVQKHEIDDYWSTFWLIETPGFTKIVPRNRFERITSFLHYKNNELQIARGYPGHDRLLKIRPLVDRIVPQFSQCFKPGKEISLDEMTVAFKGRNIMKQYNKSKLDKWGYKAFALSDSSTGYVLKWYPNLGKNRNSNGEMSVNDDVYIRYSYQVVKQLMSEYTNVGHCLYIDSYYTSVPLAKELNALRTGVCGTIISNRKGMPNISRPTN